MTKLKVTAARAADPKLDVVGLLRRLSVTEIPPNVVRELSDWSEHGEKLVLYPDCAVLEADQDLKSAAPFTIESIAPGILLVHSPDKLFSELERQQLMPLRVKHGKDRFSAISGNARTRFPKRQIGEKKTPASKVPVTLMRVTRIQLMCPNREFLDRLHRVLIEANCPIETDVKKLVLYYTKTHESRVSDALRSLKQEYQITIEDAG
jgi:hypothetical protein